MRIRGAAACLIGFLALAAPASAQETVRLAAPADCLTNPGCGPGLARVYGLDVSGVHVPLEVADAGIQALDDGLGEVAVAFSSNPEVSRPDILTLDDDREMVALGPHRAGRALVAAAGLRAPGARHPASSQRGLGRADHAGAARAQPAGHRRAAARGGGRRVHRRQRPRRQRSRRAGPRIVVGFQDFAENETLAYMYAEALRAGGYRVAVRSVGGLRRQAVRQLRRGDVDTYPAYSGSLMSFLGDRPDDDRRLRRALRRALRRKARAQPLQARARREPQRLRDEDRHRPAPRRREDLGSGEVLAGG